MTTKDELHQAVGALDPESAEEALAYLQSRGMRGVRGEPPKYGATEREAARAELEHWEDEGGSQATRRTESPTTARDNLHHLVDRLDGDSAVETLAYLQSLRRPRLLSEAGINDVPGTEDEQAEAIEAWQLDRRHALDER